MMTGSAASKWKKFGSAVVVSMIVILIFIPFRGFQSLILYAHVFNFPFWLSDTAYHGLPEARNIRITLEDGSHVSGWHVLPAGKLATMSALITDPTALNEFFDEELRMSHCIVLSLHGNAGNRGAKHRVAENRMLTSHLTPHNCHLLAIDYRGFGDSTGWPIYWPTEESTAQDTIALWHWVENHVFFGEKLQTITLENTQYSEACTANRCASEDAAHHVTKPPKVFIYGHSLGCATSTQLASYLSSRPHTTNFLTLSGLILVAPFTSVLDAAMDYPYTSFLKLIPFATDILVHFLHFSYSNVDAISSITCPILIIHGKDDRIIPVEHGKRLTEVYANRTNISCIARDQLVSTETSFSGSYYECSSITGGVLNDVKDFRYISFVEVQDAGHNWLFTRREWLGTVPAFISRFC